MSDFNNDPRKAKKEVYRETVLRALAQIYGANYHGGYSIMTPFAMVISSDADETRETVRVHIAPTARPGEQVIGTYEDLRWEGDNNDPVAEARRLSIGQFRRFFPPFGRGPTWRS